MKKALIAAVVTVAGGAILWAGPQLGPFSASPEHPAINYDGAPTTEAVGALNRKLSAGATRLSRDSSSGYLHSVLQALNIPVDSQIMVFSKTGLQGPLTNPHNPRALFFNDSVILGYVRGAPVLELIAHDARQGAIFYLSLIHI